MFATLEPMAVVRSFGAAERQARLATRHHLLPSARTDDVVKIATDLIGLHSTDPVSVYLSATARMANPSLTAIETALYDHRTLVRHHAMRRTLWVFTPHIARLAHASSTAGLLATERRAFLKMLDSAGVPDGDTWIRDARRDLLAALDELCVATARQLGDALPALKVPLTLSAGKAYEGTQSAHTRVLLLLGFEGTVVRARPTGTWINGQYRWTAMDTWLPRWRRRGGPGRGCGRAGRPVAAGVRTGYEHRSAVVDGMDRRGDGEGTRASQSGAG